MTFDRSSDAAWLVEGDSFAERGDEALAAAFHAVGGRIDLSTTRARELVALIIGTSACIALDGTNSTTLSKIERSLHVLARGAVASWPSGGGKLAPVVEALTREDFPGAVRAARTLGDSERWLTLFRYAVRLERPFTPREALATELSQLAVDFLQPPPHSLSIDFANVPVSNNETGISGAFVENAKFARDVFVVPSGLPDPDDEDEENVEWMVLTPWECVHELHALQAANDGQPIRLGDRDVSVEDLLDRAGPCLGGAHNDSLAPFTVLQFERAMIALRAIS